MCQQEYHVHQKLSPSSLGEAGKGGPPQQVVKVTVSTPPDIAAHFYRSCI